jgi:hypothetical protein
LDRPSLPAEYIIKGIIYALMGIETNKKEYLDTAIQYLHLVGFLIVLLQNIHILLNVVYLLYPGW